MRTILFLIAAMAIGYSAMNLGAAGSSIIEAHAAKMESVK